MFTTCVRIGKSLRVASSIRGLLVQETRAAGNPYFLCFNDDAEMHAYFSDLFEHDGSASIRENASRTKPIQFQVHSYSEEA